MNYEQLKDAIGTWLNSRGSEPTLAANLDLLIELAEARINQDLRLQGMIHKQNFYGTGLESSVLPEDCLEVDRVTTREGSPLLFRRANEVESNPQTKQCMYAIDGRILLFSKPLDGFTLRYFKRLDTLKDVGTTWLSKQAANLYLYAALIDANIFDLGEDREQQRYAAAYGSIVSRLQYQDDKAQTAQSDFLQSTTVGSLYAN